MEASLGFRIPIRHVGDEECCRKSTGKVSAGGMYRVHAWMSCCGNYTRKSLMVNENSCHLGNTPGTKAGYPQLMVALLLASTTPSRICQPSYDGDEDTNVRLPIV